MVDIQVTTESAMLLALVVHVTGLPTPDVCCLIPSTSTVSEIVPHTVSADTVYVTVSFGAAETLSTVQFGVPATDKQAVIKRN